MEGIKATKKDNFPLSNHINVLTLQEKDRINNESHPNLLQLHKNLILVYVLTSMNKKTTFKWLKDRDNSSLEAWVTSHLC